MTSDSLRAKGHFVPSTLEEEIDSVAQALEESLTLSGAAPAAGVASEGGSAGAEESAVPCAKPALHGDPAVGEGSEDAAEPWQLVEAAAESSPSSPDTVGGDAPAAADAAPVPPPEASTGVAASTPASWLPVAITPDDPRLKGAGLRFYAVGSLCRTAGGRQYAGVHVSKGTSAYNGILSLNGGFGGIRWQRRPSLQSAVERYREELASHDSPSSPRFWFWCPRL